MGSCGWGLNPPRHENRVWKIPLPREKHKKINVEKNPNRNDFHSSVTLTKGFGCFWDTFGRLKGLQGTQLGGGIHRKANE